MSPERRARALAVIRERVTDDDGCEVIHVDFATPERRAELDNARAELEKQQATIERAKARSGVPYQGANVRLMLEDIIRTDFPNATIDVSRASDAALATYVETRLGAGQ